MPSGCIGKPPWLDTEAAWVGAKGWATGRREGPGERGSPRPPRSQQPLGLSGPEEAAPAVPAPTHSVHAAESRDAERAPRSPAPPARGHPFPEPRRALPCLQTQPARLSTAFLESLPRLTPPRVAVAGPRCAFPPSLLGAPTLLLPTLRRSWLPVQHSPLSHRWVFVSVCPLSLCPAGLLSYSLLDPTTASPRGWEGNRCSVKCLLGD